jgi:hypothetical protein
LTESSVIFAHSRSGYGAETEGASVRLAKTKRQWNTSAYAVAARQADDNGEALPWEDVGAGV